MCVRLHISAAATGNAGLCLAAVVRAALDHVKNLTSRLRAMNVRSCEHVANRAARDSSRSDGRNRFLLRLLFRVELCSSNGNDVGVFEHARS